LVPGDVDDGDAPGREVEPSEAELDRDAAGLLLCEAIGVDAGQVPDERGLTVVDVAGGADDGQDVAVIADGCPRDAGHRCVAARIGPADRARKAEPARRRPALKARLVIGSVARWECGRSR